MKKIQKKSFMKFLTKICILCTPPFGREVFRVLGGFLWSILDEHWRKSSRNDPEAPYLPQSPKFLQENPKNRQRTIQKKTKKSETSPRLSNC